MTNKTIGMVTCPLCDEPAAVRKNKNGKFYYISRAGLITPSADFGQTWFVENAEIWGEGGPPTDAPDWIREDRSNPDNTLSQVRTKPAAEPESSPVADDDADAGGDHPAPDPPPADADDDSLFGDFLTGDS